MVLFYLDNRQHPKGLNWKSDFPNPDLYWGKLPFLKPLWNNDKIAEG